VSGSPEPSRLRGSARDRWAVRFLESVQLRDCSLYDYFLLHPEGRLWDYMVSTLAGMPPVK
jgi:hypothetical protein